MRLASLLALPLPAPEGMRILNSSLLETDDEALSV